MELQKPETGLGRRALEKAAAVFSRFRKDPETIRTEVLAKHGPRLEAAKTKIFDVEGTTGVWSWKHFGWGWEAELGSPALSRKERAVFAKELIDALALELSKVGVDAKERQEHAAVLFHGAKVYGILGKISDDAAKAIFTELHVRVGTEWPPFAEARVLARKRGWKEEAHEMAEKRKEFERDLFYLGCVTEPGFEKRRESLAKRD
jgi:hypothetical protein